ncbi:hypothetical protein MMC30_007345 [Trapelia coarctata]|nr:hypothetical protein [Trapelia coarctata]
MAALTFISYKPPVSIPKDPSAKGFRSISNFSKSCDELTKSASQHTNRLVSQQRDKTFGKVHDRKFPAVFQDPFRGQSECTMQWLRNEPFPDCADYAERKDDGSSKVQNRGDCQDDPFVIKDDCDDATSRYSMDSQFSPVDPVNPIEGNIPAASRPSSEWDRGMQGYDLIECLDMTGPPPTELLDLSHEPALDLNGAEVHAGGPSNGLHTQGSHGHGGREEEDEFPSVEELLGSRGAQGSQRWGSSGDHRAGRSGGVFKYSAESDCNSAPTPGSRRHGNGSGDLDSRNRVYTSDSSTSEKQGGTQGSLSTPPTSVVGSEAGYPALPEKDDPIPDLPPFPRNILLSSTHGEMNDEVTCESSRGGCRDIESVHSAGEDEEDKYKGNEWEDAKAEADEGMVPNRDGNQNKTSMLSSTKRRGRSTLGERPPSQRRSKRCRSSSALSSDDETESDDESAISSRSEDDISNELSFKDRKGSKGSVQIPVIHDPNEGGNSRDTELPRKAYETIKYLPAEHPVAEKPLTGGNIARDFLTFGQLVVPLTYGTGKGPDYEGLFGDRDSDILAS